MPPKLGRGEGRRLEGVPALSPVELTPQVFAQGSPLERPLKPRWAGDLHRGSARKAPACAFLALVSRRWYRSMSTEQAAQLLEQVAQTNQLLGQVLAWQHSAQVALVGLFWAVCSVVFFSVLSALLRR